MGHRSSTQGAKSGNLDFSEWKISNTRNETQRHISSDDEPLDYNNEGFTTVSKHVKRDAAPTKTKHGPSSKIKPLKETSRVGTYPPSAAAASRAGAYAHRPKSLYKQEFLPIEERDPTLVAAQANKGIRMAKEAYRPGMIIRAAVHEQALKGVSGNSNATLADQYITESRYGPICTKYRRMIVIWLYQDHYQTIPIFSHNGNGLVGKARPSEFISIQDHRVKGDFTALSRHQPIITERFNEGIFNVHPKSTLHLACSLYRKYDLPVIPEGFITKEQLSRLIRLFNSYGPRA